MTTPLVIFGTSSFAEIAALYFSRGDEYEPISFCVDDEYADRGEIYGLPLFPLSQLTTLVPPTGVSFHVAVTYTHLNRLRHLKVKELKSMGYKAASYISPDAHIDPTARLGEHVFVFEDNTIQPYTTIGDRVILWSGNHIGHHSTIGSDVFVSSHVVVSGHCSIGARSFLGVNCAIGNNVAIGEDNWVLPGSNILSDTEANQMWRPAKPSLSSKAPVEEFAHEVTLPE